jgi:hypothetical protein
MSMLAQLATAAGASLAPHAVPDPGPPRFAQVVDDRDRLFVLEAVYEGYLMHYGTPRAFRGMDDDLCLLAGDALYALGLSRLAREGDLHAVAELADLISLTARAHADGVPQLTEQMWVATALALSSDGGPGVREAVGDRLEEGQGRLA